MAKPQKPRGNAGQGRPRGAPNKATRELRALAREYTEQALLVLAEMMGDRAAPHAARVHAATALLDRGHGKPRQEFEHSGSDLWSFCENRVAVRFAYEWHEDSGNWFWSFGNENGEFDERGLMRRRIASINDLPIRESESPVPLADRAAP
jgi:nuclear transport factor 2 (NTF2) superfamily protein